MLNSSRNYLSFLLLFLLLVITSCKKDTEEVFDIRDQLVGTYTYLGGGAGFPRKLQIEVSKDAQYPEKIKLVFVGMNYAFQAENVTPIEEGISFEIPTQLTYISGFPFVTEGKPLVKAGDQYYQAVLFSNEKELHLGLKATIINSSLQEVGNFDGLIVAYRNQ